MYDVDCAPNIASSCHTLSILNYVEQTKKNSLAFFSHYCLMKCSHGFLSLAPSLSSWTCRPLLTSPLILGSNNPLIRSGPRKYPVQYFPFHTAESAHSPSINHFGSLVSFMRHKPDEQDPPPTQCCLNALAPLIHDGRKRGSLFDCASAIRYSGSGSSDGLDVACHTDARRLHVIQMFSIESNISTFSSQILSSRGALGPPYSSRV